MKPVVLVEHGEVIADRYEIDSPIGQGGMAVVYRARHRTSGKACALKLLQGRWLEEEGLLDRFLKEARILGRIGAHPNIVNVFDAGLDEQRGVPYIAMELLEGQTLADYLDGRAPLSPLVARAILTQVTGALEEAHRMGIVHRDLKPANIFVSVDEAGTPKIKVLDFGIAKEADHTRTSTEVGTPGMEAPEQLGADIRDYAATQGVTITRGISPQTDVWALGLLAYRVFTGRSARQYWGEASAGAVILAVAVGTRPRPSERAEELASHLPPGFDAWFLRCLDSDAKARWPSAAAALAALFDEAAPDEADGGKPPAAEDEAPGDGGDSPLPPAPHRPELLTVADAPQAKAAARGPVEPADEPPPDAGERPRDEAPEEAAAAPRAAPAPPPAEPAEPTEPRTAPPARSTARQALPWVVMALIVGVATLIGVLRPRPRQADPGLPTSAPAATAAGSSSQPRAPASAGGSAPASATTTATVSATASNAPTSGPARSAPPPTAGPRPAPSKDEFDALFGNR